MGSKMVYVEVGPKISVDFWSANGFKELKKCNSSETDNFIIETNCFRFNDTTQFVK